MRVTNENLQNLLATALHNPRPTIVEPDPMPLTTPLGTSPVDQLVRSLALATNQDVESYNAQALTIWENLNRTLATAINETIQQEEPRAE